jgi:hypothetical protein
VSAHEAAVAAARCGWAVFPCRPGDKRPAVERWEQRACSDAERVTRYWPGPRHNVGIACGPSRLVVIDLDTPEHGGQLPEEWGTLPGIKDGADVLAELAARAGQPWPVTYTVLTPSGGTHLYFRAPGDREIRNSASKLGPMVDVRAVGGYVVGAGSAIGGRVYEAVDQAAPVPLPGWLADLAAPRQHTRPPDHGRPPGRVYGRLRGVVEAVLSSEPGTRNGRLYWAACRAAEMVAAGQVDLGTAERVLVDAALEAGLRGGEAEARRTVASGMKSIA